MVKNSKGLHFYSCILSGVAIGLCFPFMFTILDLKQLGLKLTFTNMYEVYNSQNIYFFSATLFPILFGTIGGLFSHIFTQNKKLAFQEGHIKNIFNALVDCVLVCDADGKIQYANDVFYSQFSQTIKSTETLLGIKNLDQISHGQIFEIKVINKHDEERTVHYTVSAALSTQSYIVSIRDIEESRKNEIIIESQKAQLFEASKLSALGQMAAGFAHEINNPLAIINGKIMVTERELRKEEICKEAIYRNLETCRKMVVRITKIIKGLRNLSHSNDDQPEVVSIKDLMEDFIIMANLKITGRGVEFIVDMSSVEDEMINCNPVQISQVLMNLFNNAIDAIEDQERPWFAIVIEKNEDLFKFTVTDSGKGIPQHVQQRIFEPMFTTKAVGKGTGLGLSISRAIIEKHQGRITINNQHEHTCFEIILPKNISTTSAVPA